MIYRQRTSRKYVSLLSDYFFLLKSIVLFLYSQFNELTSVSFCLEEPGIRQCKAVYYKNHVCVCTAIQLSEAVLGYSLLRQTLFSFQRKSRGTEGFTG